MEQSWKVQNCTAAGFVPDARGECNTVKLLYAMWTTGCLMMLVYVMYNMCRFCLNHKRRDKLTIIIQCLSLASLVARFLEGGWCLASAEYKTRVIYSFVGSVLFSLAVSIYFFSWLDITVLIRHLGQQGSLTDEAIKMKFNRCEWRLLYLLWATQILFASAGVYNIVVWSIKGNETVSFLVEACLYFMQLVIEIIISALFIVTLRTQRSSLWGSKKVEVRPLSVSHALAPLDLSHHHY